LTELTVPSGDGMKYAPKGKPSPVCGPGEFFFSAVGLDHGHIYGMCNGLVEAGAELAYVYDPDPAKVAEFQAEFPAVRVAESELQVLSDESVQLIAAAAVPADRADLGLRAMDHGKDYFTDKPPLTTLTQLASVREKVAVTGRKYAVYFSERLHSESAVFAGGLIEDGAIGRVVQVLGLGPHRLNAATRPEWFFEADRFGGILCDIGSHQVEQFLFFSGAADAEVVSSRVANYNHKAHPHFEDFGDCTLVGDNGAVGYFRVDWFTPDGLGTWGDGRTFILGTEGYIELRKYIDVARQPEGDQVYLVDHSGEHHFGVHGQVGYPFFGQFIKDCLVRSDRAMTQEHAFKAAELCIRAQMRANRIES
jgi:predicted dehydrogenase